MKSLVLDIQRGSKHDGPGIRTTLFLKGCPLNCAWCHNPESKSFAKQLFFTEERCTGCRKCSEVCSQKVHCFDKDTHSIDFKKCISCGKCVDVCPSKALKICGKEMSVNSVMKEILKDREFYNQTGGGVTISGGEPLSHIEYIKDILLECKINGIHTCIETSGICSISSVQQIIPLVDLFLIDYKVTGKENYLKWIGTDNDSFPFELLKICKANDKKVILRCPLIPDVNDNDVHFDSIAEILKDNRNIIRAEILPYHDFGVTKSNSIGIGQMICRVPDDEEISKWLGYFKDKKIENIIRS